MRGIYLLIFTLFFSTICAKYVFEDDMQRPTKHLNREGKEHWESVANDNGFSFAKEIKTANLSKESDVKSVIYTGPKLGAIKVLKLIRQMILRHFKIHHHRISSEKSIISIEKTLDPDSREKFDNSKIKSDEENVSNSKHNKFSPKSNNAENEDFDKIVINPFKPKNQENTNVDSDSDRPSPGADNIKQRLSLMRPCYGQSCYNDNELIDKLLNLDNSKSPNQARALPMPKTASNLVKDYVASAAWKNKAIRNEISKSSNQVLYYGQKFSDANVLDVIYQLILKYFNENPNDKSEECNQSSKKGQSPDVPYVEPGQESSQENSQKNIENNSQKKSEESSKEKSDEDSDVPYKNVPNEQSISNSNDNNNNNNGTTNNSSESLTPVSPDNEQNDDESIQEYDPTDQVNKENKYFGYLCPGQIIKKINQPSENGLIIHSLKSPASRILFS